MPTEQSIGSTDELSLAIALNHFLDKEPELLSLPENSFPTELWQKLAVENLLTPLLPANLGGQNRNYTEITQAAKVLTHRTGLPGLSMAWVMQQLLTRMIASCKSDAIRKNHLPKLLSGEALCSLSISEPGAGAHPKRLSTRADRNGDGYILNGEKTYVTNGPYAELFIILAITAVENGRKAFTAFIVPKDTTGLIIKPMKGFDALAPSSHCGLILDDCYIPESYILGEKGDAFNSISKPFRELEDVLMLSPLSGAMQSLIDMLIAFDNTLLSQENLGRLIAMVDAVSALGMQASAQLDKTNRPLDPVSFIIVGRLLVEQFNDKIKELLAEQVLNSTIKRLSNDIDVLVNIAKTANTAKQISLAERYLTNHKNNN